MFGCGLLVPLGVTREGPRNFYFDCLSNQLINSTHMPLNFCHLNLAIRRKFLLRRHSFHHEFYTTINSSSSLKMDPAELAKEAAAIKAIDDHIKEDCSVGIGSGSTIVYAVKQLAKIIKKDNLKISCVPTSIQAKQLIREHKLCLSDLEETPQLDFVFDGADEVDSNLTLIKGGGGCLTQEKIVASCTKNLIILADHRKDSKNLGTNWTKGIPVEVIPMAYVPIKNKLEAMGGVAELRMAKAKAGPVVTDNGNFILDWKFGLNLNDADWEKVDKKITCFPGVVDTGLFVNMATKVYFGQADGTVVMKNRKEQ